MQGAFFMKIDQITPSILTVCSDLSVDIKNDLQLEQTKSIAKLLEEKDEKEKEENGQPPTS